MKKEINLIKSTFIIMIISLFSRMLGFVRDILIGNNFGVGIYTDAYNIAVTIPETIFMLIGLAISTAFLPMLSKIRAKSGDEEMYDFANNIISILFVFSIIFLIITSIFTEEIVKLLVSKEFSKEALYLAIKLTRITLLNLLFLSVNACFTAMLQVNEDFVIPSILGLFFNLPMILYLIFFKNYDIVGLTICNVIGNFFRVVVQIPSLISHGYKYSFKLNFYESNLKEIITLIIPVIIGAGANSLNMIVDKKIASSLPIGSISALDYGQKLIVFISTIITTSIVNISYPVMANLINDNKHDEFMKVLKQSIMYIAIMLVPITAGIIVLGRNVVEIVYKRGAFDESAVILTTFSFVGYGCGVFFTGLRDLLNSTLFSMGKTTVTTKNGIIGVLSNIILSLILSRYFGIIGVAIASSLSMMITSILLFVSIEKIQNNFKYYDLIKKILLLTISAVIMSIVIIIIKHYLIGVVNEFALLSISIFCAIIVYFFMSYVFKIREVLNMTEIILKKVRK